MDHCVTSEISGGICVLTLVAPEKRNAISIEMRTELRDLACAAADNDDVRVIIITGYGEHFSSGGQIAQANGAALKPDAERTRRNIGILHDIIRIFAAGKKPVIAAVEGAAYGAGMSFVSACDYVVVGKSARFCASFGKVGLMADSGLVWTLAQRVGRGRARDLLFTARVLGAEEAEQIGFANKMVEDGDALAAAKAVAADLLLMAPLAIASMKSVFNERSTSLEDVLAAELEIQPQLTFSKDYSEGRAAFKEKRRPAFQGN